MKQWILRYGIVSREYLVLGQQILVERWEGNDTSKYEHCTCEPKATTGGNEFGWNDTVYIIVTNVLKETVTLLNMTTDTLLNGSTDRTSRTRRVPRCH
jgi:hypothetical protein